MRNVFKVYIFIFSRLLSRFVFGEIFHFERDNEQFHLKNEASREFRSNGLDTLRTKMFGNCDHIEEQSL